MGAQCNRAKSIFLAAIDEYAPSQWPAFLDQSCAGDSLLRGNVEKLLRAHAAIGSFHETTRPALPATVDYSGTGILGTTIGTYKLLEQIGEGGFGVVYMAEQQEPIRRRIVLKILKPGMDTKQVLARFESERQALALMDHVGIARVLDAGATESGRPYFAMELIKGMPITEFCDNNRLSLEARLRLFIEVCHAIQHAHHKGIIHRDIKPTNVMVTLNDGKPVIKVIDFGMAKATMYRLTERTLFTAFGQMIGTPAYMSPEQAEMSGLDIDTRSDVYGLGVLLYELLTGTTPLEDKRLREASYVEMQRLIREEEARRPSLRLSELGDSASELAGDRGLDVKRLAQLLACDLDWVVLKAIEKDRERRYDTPGSLAEDIERYLRRQAILARPPSRTDRLKKFAQRNWAAVSTATAMLAALLVGAAVATWQAVVATRAKREAVAAVRAEKEAEELAQTREAETKAALEFVENRVFAVARPRGHARGLGRDVTLRRAVEAALPFVEKSFTDKPLIEARLRLTLGKSFLYLGEPRIAANQDELARAIYTKALGPDHPDTLTSQFNLATDYADLGWQDDALKLREETLALRTARLGPDHPDTLSSMSAVANSWHALGRHEDALELHTQTLALRRARLGSDHPDTLTSMHNVACCSGDLGRPDQALKLCEETLALQQAKLGPDHPDTLKSRFNLAIRYDILGRRTDALRLREETVALQDANLGPDHPDTLRSKNSLANSYLALERYADAIKLYEQTMSLQEAKLGPSHSDTLASMNNLAWCLAIAPDESLRDPANAVEHAARATQFAPLNECYHGTLGTARYSAGDWKGAIADLEKAINLRKADDPTNAFEGFFLAMACWKIGEKDKARSWFAKSVQWMEKGEEDIAALKHFRIEAAKLLDMDRRG
jgi:serine/threonine protein kinase